MENQRFDREGRDGSHALERLRAVSNVAGSGRDIERQRRMVVPQARGHVLEVGIGPVLVG